jgi:hypothetical protein
MATPENAAREFVNQFRKKLETKKAYIVVEDTPIVEEDTDWNIWAITPEVFITIYFNKLNNEDYTGIYGFLDICRYDDNGIYIDDNGKRYQSFQLGAEIFIEPCQPIGYYEKLVHEVKTELQKMIKGFQDGC